MLEQAALEHLTQPALLPTFASEILLQLLKHSKDPDLPLAYYHAVSPPLQLNSEVRREYFKFLARGSVQQAFFASRGQPDHQTLFEIIIEAVLSEPETRTRADAGTALVDLPLTAEEEEWFEEYLSGQGSVHPGAADTLIMRKIAMGKGSDALGIEGRLRDHKVDGVDWNVVKSGLSRANSSTKSLTSR